MTEEEDLLVYLGGSLPDKAYYKVVEGLLKDKDMLKRLGNISIGELGCLDFLEWVQEAFIRKWAGERDKRLDSLVQAHIDATLGLDGKDRGKWMEILKPRLEKAKRGWLR
jgi:hypothetical protein